MATTGSILSGATGSVTHSKETSHATTLIQISGTYGTVTFVLEGNFDGGTNWFPLVAVDLTTGTVVTGTISPTDNETNCWRVSSEGMVQVRARATLVTTGTVTFTLGGGSFIGQPFISLNNSGNNVATQLGFTVGASTAGAGTTTANANALPAGTGTVYPTTAADGTVGVRINVADQVTGRCLFVGNGVSNQILKIYAPSGGKINGAAADAAYSTASGKGALVVCLSGSGNTWLAIG